MEKYRQDSYNRITAVNYALKYALSPNPAYKYFPLIGNSSGDCANFISQCLFAGGIKMNFSAKNPWWYRNQGTAYVGDDTWSVSWSVAHSLYWLLKVNKAQNLAGPKGDEVTNTAILNVGDLVFFEDRKALIFHSAIITSFRSNKEPLISHHSFEALNIPISSSWPAAKIHYLKVTA